MVPLRFCTTGVVNGRRGARGGGGLRKAPKRKIGDGIKIGRWNVVCGWRQSHYLLFEVVKTYVFGQ